MTLADRVAAAIVPLADDNGHSGPRYWRARIAKHVGPLCAAVEAAERMRFSEAGGRVYVTDPADIYRLVEALNAITIAYRKELTK